MKFTKETFYDVAIGEVFKWDGCLWVCADFNEFCDKYCSICIAHRGKHYIGERMFFEDDVDVETICYNYFRNVLEEN